MKRFFLHAYVLICILGVMSSCDHRITPETVSGTYHGTMDIKINIPNISQEGLEFPNEAVVTKVDETHIDVTIDLDLSKYISESLSALIGENINYGTITGRCLVGPTVDGEASLSGTVTVGNQSIPIYGEYDDKTLDITFALGLVTIEFEGVRR